MGFSDVVRQGEQEFCSGRSNSQSTQVTNSVPAVVTPVSKESDKKVSPKLTQSSGHNIPIVQIPNNLVEKQCAINQGESVSDEAEVEVTHSDEGGWHTMSEGRMKGCKFKNGEGVVHTMSEGRMKGCKFKGSDECDRATDTDTEAKKSGRSTLGHPISTQSENPPILASVASMVRAKLGSGNVDLLLDSGAAISVLSESLRVADPIICTYPIEPGEFSQAAAVNGQVMKLKGKITLPVHFGSTTLTHPFYIVPQMTSQLAILGRDFLSQNQAILDFASSTLRIPGLATVPLIGAVSLDHSEPVRCSQSLSIPALAEVITFVDTFDQLPEGHEGLLQEPSGFYDRHKLCIAAVMVKVRNRAVPVRVLNPNQHAVQLKAGDLVGYVTPVQENIPAVGMMNVVTDEADLVEAVDDFRPIDTTPELEQPLLEIIDLSKADVTPEQRERLREFIEEHSDMFVMRLEDLTVCNLGEHDIQYNGPPVVAKPYRLGPVREKILEEEVQKLIKVGILEECNSHHASPLIVVTSPGRKPRLCADYRALNKGITRNLWPQTPQSFVLNSFTLAKKPPALFSTLDAKAGYWQIRMTPQASKLAALTTQTQLLCPTRCPFGLVNAPATFCRVMNICMSGLIGIIASYYLDDVIVWGTDFEDMLENLRIVLGRFRKANLKLHPGKCIFARKQLKFLAHVISAEGIAPDQEKVRQMLDLPVPTGQKGVKKYLGSINYYRKFIAKFAEKAAPLTNLLRKDVPFNWTSECQKALELIKQALSTAPILRHVDFEKNFLLRTDASTTGIAGVLFQEFEGKRHPIAYFSKALSRTQQKWTISELELYALVSSIRHFKLYLAHKEFIAEVDHKALICMATKRFQVPKLERYAIALQAYDFKLRHVSGSLLNLTDLLSRYLPEGETQQIAQILPTTGAVKPSVIITAQRADGRTTAIIDFLEKGKLPVDESEAKVIRDDAENGTIIDDILFQVDDMGFGGDKKFHYRAVIPSVLTPQVLEFAHNSAVMGGHLGQQKTLDRIRFTYTWPGMRADVKTWVASCLDCQCRMPPHSKPRSPLLPSDSYTPFEILALDCKGPLTTSSEGYKHILVMTDQFTKFTILRPLKSTTTEEVTRQLYDVTCTFGPPKTILTDGASYFKAKQLKAFCRMTNIAKLVANPYCPKTVGLVEVRNKVLGQALSKYIDPSQTDWHRFLPGLQFALNTTVTPAVNLTAYHLMFGRPCRSPLDYSLHVPRDPECTKDEHVQAITRDLELAYKIAREQLKLTRAQMKKRYDESAKDPKYKVGDLVWVLQPRKSGSKGQSKSLYCPYHGPYYIVQVLAQKNIKVRSMSHQGVPIVIHVDRLKPFIPATRRPDPVAPLPWPGDPIPEELVPKDQLQLDEDQDPGENLNPTLDTAVDSQLNPPAVQGQPLATPQPEPQSDVYEVERILKKRTRNGKLQFLIRWKGYSQKHDQWVNQEDIVSPMMIKNFLEQPKRKRKRQSRY
jgi:hypothetical protein